jgi:hypothetical protein
MAPAVPDQLPLRRSCIMNRFIVSLALASGVLAPALAFAQSADSLTRAQVRADLIRVEQAGYNPASNDDSTYPADIQAAEAKAAAQSGATDVGGSMQGSTSSSRPMNAAAAKSTCVGPASFCTPYFGN